MADPVRRGDVFFVEVSVDAQGGHKKERPLLVVQSDKLSPWKTVLVVPLASEPIGNASADRFTWEVLKARNNFLAHTSYAQCARLGQVKRDELKKRMGTIHVDDLRAVELRMQSVLGIVA